MLDLELLASIASGGLGQWVEGRDGRPVYVKSEDCIGARSGALGQHQPLLTAAVWLEAAVAVVCAACDVGSLLVAPRSTPAAPPELPPACRCRLPQRLAALLPL